MDRPEDPRDASVTDLSRVREQSEPNIHPATEPDSWQGLTEFVDQFDDAVFGVLADPADSPEGFWVVQDIDKVRPAAVPIDQGPTFDMAVLGPSGEVVDELRLSLSEIEHVRAAEPSGVPEEPGEG